MNTQIEFDEDNNFFGDEERNYVRFYNNKCTCANYENDIKKILRKLKKLQKEIYEKDQLLEEARKTNAVLEESKKINAVLQHELNLVEEVCFKNSDGFYPYILPENTLAFRIRKRLVEIKIELNKKAKLSGGH
jgi:hypothetical protein